MILNILKRQFVPIYEYHIYIYKRAASELCPLWSYEQNASLLIEQDLNCLCVCVSMCVFWHRSHSGLTETYRTRCITIILYNIIMNILSLLLLPYSNNNNDNIFIIVYYTYNRRHVWGTSTRLCMRQQRWWQKQQRQWPRSTMSRCDAKATMQSNEETGIKKTGHMCQSIV